MVTAVLLFACVSPGQRTAGPIGWKPPVLERTGDPYLAPPPRRTSPRRILAVGGFTSVQVNVDANGNNILGDAANEPSIAISALDPDVIVVGWRQFDNVASNFRQAGYGYSHDGGATWTFPGVHDPGVFRSDPVLGSSTDGAIYYNSLTVAGSTYRCDNYVTLDGGLSWSGPNFSYGGDKQWFTVDKSNSSGRNFIYEAWSTAGNSYFPNQFSRSTDRTLNWLSPVEVPPQRQVWGTLTVDPNGDLYVAGQRNGAIYVSKSTNAKLGLQTPTFDFTLNVPFGGTFISNTGPNPGGLLGQVWVASDHSGTATHGNVYLLSSVNPPGDDPLDVFFSRSENGGATWSAPVRITDGPLVASSWQWFGTMAVAPNGRIDAVWNDTRESLQTTQCRTYYSYSLDGGRKWSKNVPLTPQWNSVIGWPNQNKIGDYYDMVSDDTGVNLAYAATFNGEQDVYFLRIVPAPPVSPDSFTIVRGSLSSGGLASLSASDNDRLAVRAGLVLTANEAPVQVEFEGTVPTAAPQQLGFLLEAAVNTPGLEQTVQLYNFTTGSYETLDTRPATTADSLTHVLVSTNPARFIDPATLRVRAKVLFRRTGLTLVWPWTASFDRTSLTLTP
jgi:hypothetical protein